MTNPLNLTNWQTRKYQTREGQAVRLLCIDAKSERPIIGVAFYEGREETLSWYLDGRSFFGASYPYDLINAPQKRMGWVNVYPKPKYFESDGGFLAIAAVGQHVFKSEQDANDKARQDRIACVPIEWEE